MGFDLTPLNTTRRILIETELQPVQGHRFQPTGFPDLGAATYQAGEISCLLLESAQSMANRLEGTIWDEGAGTLTDGVTGISYVIVNDDAGNYLTSSISEPHRLNSPYILASKDKEFFNELKESLAVTDDGPINRSTFTSALLKYDVNSLLHGVFLVKASARLRIPRVISSFIEAERIQTAASGGVKNDHLNSQGDTAKGFGNVIFHREEFTAEKIVAYFSVDLQQIRGYGLGEDVENLLILLALYKIRALLDGNLRLRTACDLELKNETVVASKPSGFELPSKDDLGAKLKDAINICADKMKITTVVFKK